MTLRLLVMLAGLWVAAAQTSSVAATVLAPPAAPGPSVKPFVKVPPGRIALTHVRVIDGTGSAAQDDRTVLIDAGKIVAVQSASVAIPAGTKILDLTGDTVMAGIIGMHNHLYYIARPDLDANGHSAPPVLLPQMTFSAPLLYLASGVTTIRTAGSVEPYADLNLKQRIDAGDLPGPHIDVTAPYLEGRGSAFIQMHQLAGPDDARRTVAFWADQGATSFKAYMNITQAELKAAADEAHRHGLKITGHLCSVTYAEAVAAGIDNLEHGFYANTALDPGKMPDACPATSGLPTLLAMEADNAQAKALINLLVDHRAALTPTLPVFESYGSDYQPLAPQALELLSAEARADYGHLLDFIARRTPQRKADLAQSFAHEMALERAFVAAGGLLIAGPDPTGIGDVIPGLGDHRGIELLVKAGFTPVAAIRIATLNGATYLGLADRIGSITPGKNADLYVVRGNPATRIADIENAQIVFKDGVGYDPALLLTAVRGRYGQY